MGDAAVHDEPRTCVPSQSLPTCTVGPYVIEREAARGGQGVVHRAVHRTTGAPVALKRTTDPDDPAAEARATREIEALARLDHPGIVRLLGVEEQGRVRHLVLEWVDGVPLDAWLREAARPWADVVSLIASVCEALAHAHHRGVVHRDVKPSNILVDRAGAPRLIDFGLARAGKGPAGRAPTLAGTPAYLAPECVAKRPDADHRADIFAVGMTLYEALTGRRPGVDLGMDHARAGSGLFGVDRPSRRRADLPADLDAVALRAIHPDPRRRFQNAALLADDLRRCVAGRPVRARMPSAAGRLKTAARRHRWRAAALAGVCVIAVGAGMFTLRTEREARSQREALASSLDVLTSLLRDARPDPVTFESNLAVRGAFDDVAAGLESWRGDPVGEARIRFELAESYNKVMRGDLALPHARRAHALLERFAGPEDRRTIRSLITLTTSLAQAEFGDEAVERGEEAVAGAVRVFGEADELTFVARNRHALALAAAGRFDEAERVHLAANASNAAQQPTTTHNLGIVAIAKGEYEKAVALSESALDARSALVGDSAPTTTSSRVAHGHALVRAGRFEEAACELREALGVLDNASVPADDPLRLAAMGVLAIAELELGELHGAEARARVVHGLALARGGEHDPQTINALNIVGLSVLRQGRSREALEIFCAVTGATAEAWGVHAARAAPHEVNLARAMLATGDDRAALAWITDVVAAAAEGLGKDHPTTLIAREVEALAWGATGERTTARALLESLLPRFVEVFGEQHPKTEALRNELGAFAGVAARAAASLER